MAVDIAFHADDNVVAIIDERVMIFARSGPLTMPALECLESMKPRLLKSLQPKGVLAVLPGTAGVSKDAIVERQRQFVRTVTAEVKDLSVGVVIVGDSIQAMAMRAVGRVFVIGRANMDTFRDVSLGARWPCRAHRHGSNDAGPPSCRDRLSRSGCDRARGPLTSTPTSPSTSTTSYMRPRSIPCQ